MRLLLSSALALLSCASASAQRAHIAPTEPLSPADERKTFKVPPGFDVQLVAAEPDIDKPIQHAFDARGRLWVTTSRHYPFAAEVGHGTDKLFVLSDFGPDGKACKVQTFADDLNIPIGILPLPDCKSCLVYSIPGIWKYTDTDGDGKADKKELLFTGFGHKDTHGMVNSFTQMPDGWVYATHGFSNTSTVKGKDGHEITMHSGNTFRFRVDGSRIEVFTRGQVNPFGMAIDPWFNLYTADCHSKPITQLIRGATYQSFSKPHDGLGFAPHVTRHDHGSTALCGLTWYDADQFPKEYLGNMFLGNVVTNRINSDEIIWHGSTPEAKEKPDFLVSSDPWFRPVDIKLGPDGALYVTDFYNKIIGHYEVDLKHPKRDKDRGRVWRIVWKGLDGKGKPPEMAFKDLTTEKIEKVEELLGHPNLTVRMFATLELIHRNSDEKMKEPKSEIGMAHWLWAEDGPRPNERVKQLKASIDPEKRPFLAAHEVRIATAREEWRRQYGPADKMQFVTPDLAKLPPQVARAYVDQITALPDAANIKSLVELLKTVPAEDTHLKYAARVALRNGVMKKGWEAAKLVAGASDPNAIVIADVALAIPGMESAYFLATRIHGTHTPDYYRWIEYAEHMGRYSPGTMSNFLLQLRNAAESSKPQAGELAFTCGAFHAFLRGVQTSGKIIDGLSDSDNEMIFKKLLARVYEDPQAARPLVEALSLFPMVFNTNESCVKLAQQCNLELMKGHSLDDQSRAVAADALAKTKSIQSVMLVGELLHDPKTGPLLKEKLIILLANMGGNAAYGEVKAALRTVPYRVIQSVATLMAGRPGGAEALLDAVRTGAAPARVLQDKIVLEKLKSSGVPNLDKQLVVLTKGLPPIEQRINDLMKKRAKDFTKAKLDKTLGVQLYTKHCAACHQIAGQGGKVGPNLDGIGNRGAERLLEDVLDPSRNVDGAFRARVLHLADGRTITGLMLRVEGKVVVMADAEGKEVRVPEADIEKNTVTNLSPMPANFDTTLPEKDFYNLLGYLLDLRPK